MFSLLRRLKIWFTRKRIAFLTWRVAAGRAKLRSLKDGMDPPMALNPALKRLIFDKQTEKLKDLQNENAHDLLGNPDFVPRQPLKDEEAEA